MHAHPADRRGILRGASLECWINAALSETYEHALATCTPVKLLGKRVKYAVHLPQSLFRCYRHNIQHIMLVTNHVRRE
jgi:hypothetical protein